MLGVADAAADRDRVALVELLDDLVLVDRVVQGLADLRVRERALLGVDQVDRHQVGEGVLHPAAARLLDLAHVVGDDLGDDLGLAASQGGHSREIVRDGLPDHPLDLGHPAPVGGVRLQHHPVVLHPLHELVGPGAHRLDRERLPVHLLDVLRREHLPPVAREALHQDRVRLAGDDVDRVGVHHVGALDGAEAAVDLVHALGDQAVDGELHRVGVERLAVVELHSLPQLELPRRVVEERRGNRVTGVGPSAA